ncbi:MAG TPA: DUF4956 domain-containing protein [Brumimicrobium sp.]|nr:DUF4956 domain-containing protein [Brumimicrobium sp.]
MIRFVLLTIFFILGSTTLFAQTEIAEVGVNSLNYNDFGVRFLINVVTIFILARIIYFSRHRNTDFLFTLMLFNVVNFLICLLLSQATLEVGFAFGLFAIFSIMRYRTVTLPVKEMGYLFLSVATGLINALALPSGEYWILIIANVFILLLTFILEKVTLSGNNKTKDIIYERIDLIKPEKREEMIADLRERTGLDVQTVEILNINFLKDIAEIKIRY